MTNTSTLKITDANGNTLSAFDSGTAASPRITVGIDVRKPGSVVSLGADLALGDAVQLRDELTRLIGAHTSGIARRSATVD